MGWKSDTKQLLDEVEFGFEFELHMINAISAADTAFILSSSQAIVNWLNALDQSDFS